MKGLKDKTKKMFFWIIIGAVLIVLYKALDNFTDVFAAIGKFFYVISPVIMGSVIAYFLYLPAKKIEEILKKFKSKFIKKQARLISVIASYILAIILIILIITLILPILVQSTVDLAVNIQNYATEILKTYNELPVDSPLKIHLVKNVIDVIKGLSIEQFININNISQYAQGAMTLFSSIINIFVAFIISVYILLERGEVCKFIKKAGKALFKEKKYLYLEKYFNNANRIFSKFISSQLIDGVIIGILATIILSLMGVKYAPLLGFIVGLFNIIPCVGPVIALIVIAVITLMSGGILQIIWLAIAIIILQQIDANFINPKLIGNTLKISPLLVITAVTIGGAYWGIVGIFLAVPISALIKITTEDYIEYKAILKKEKEKEINKKEIVEKN